MTDAVTTVLKDDAVLPTATTADAKPAAKSGLFSRSPAPSSDVVCPEETANVFARLTYTWLSPLIAVGWKRPLEASDIWALPARFRAAGLSRNIEAAWATEFAKYPESHWSFKADADPPAGDTATAADASTKDKDAAAAAAAASSGPSLRKALMSIFFWQSFPIVFLKLGADACTLSAPFVIKAIVNFVVESKNTIAVNSPLPPLSTGFGFAVLLFCLQLTSTILQNHFFFNALQIGVRLRATLITLIYRKASTLSAAARQDFNAGKIATLVSSDAQRFEFLGMNVFLAFTASLQIILITVFLYTQLGPAALVGIGLIAALGPLQNVIYGKLGAIREQVAPLTDSRVKLTQEVLQGIRVIKFFTWEQPFLEKIEAIRRLEIGLVFKRGILMAFLSTLSFAVPALSASIAFIIYGLYNPLEPGRIFAALAWFNQLPFPLFILPDALVNFAEVKVALRRITELLLAPEIDLLPAVVSDADYSIKVENGEFKWDSLPPKIDEPTDSKKDKKKWFKSKSKKGDKSKGGEELADELTLPGTPAESADAADAADAKPVYGSLRNINLTIPRGKLVAVVGTVGSGKSSLLNALIGEMKRVSGTVSFSGSLGYAPQQAWIQNASVKDNILFGLPYDEARYLATIRDCALEKDLEILPDGDLTQIGERGINLSGGQKQRINIARLVYFNSQIALLDDPLSAVDAHVGRYLFDNCLQGALAGKTRILVTHQLHFLPRVDYVVVMKDGEVAEQGTYAELMTADGEFATLMRSYGGVDEADENDEEADSTEATVKTDAPAVDKKAVVKADDDSSKGEKKEARELMKTEDRATGTVKGGVWLAYFRAAGGLQFAVGLVIVLLFSQSFSVANNVWLVVWTNQTIRGFSASQYVTIYAAIGVGASLANFCFGVYFAYSGTRAARSLHIAALAKVIRAPTVFFDMTPLGRIINRFSKDQDGIDNTLIEAFRMFLETFAMSVASFVLIIYATPLFAVPFVPVMIMYYFIQLYYRATSRELKRLDSISRSPLYANIGETINGIATIRAYGETNRFVKLNEHLLDDNVTPFFIMLASTRWLSIRLESLGATLVFFAATFGILSRENGAFTAPFLGLSLSYALQVTAILNWCIRQFTDTEIAMNAVERVNYYAKDLEVEPPAITDVRPPTGWPATGAIEFKDVSMRYAPDLPLVLKTVSFTIRDKEKIGVVGRTGSGKSSLMQVLFRMVEPAGGDIVVDGLKTTDLGLQDLRSGLGIIPQDPVLFSGTFRRNLDPFGQHTDAELWDALERANIKTKVAESDGGLDGEVQENGENLSVGQRQLLCLARAMLKRPRILIMDEATANVDYETDAIIQKCLREEFADSTVLTIAHRLNTIMDYDRVMVLSAGEIVEFDSPQQLMANEAGVFRSMVETTH